MVVVKHIITIFILSLMLHLLPVFLVPVHVGGDSLEYIKIAQNLVSGKGYAMNGEPTAYRTPGYPLFLALMYKLGWDVRIVQALLMSLIPVILYLIAYTLINPRTALITGVLALLYKPFTFMPYFFGPYFLSENLVIVTFTLFILSYVVGQKKKSLWWMGVAGLLLGVTSLIRPAFILFSVLGIRKRGAILLLVAFLTLTPWLIRNSIVFGRPLMSTQLGSVLYAGNNPQANGGWGKGEGGCKEALTYVKNNLHRYPILSLKKVYVMFQPYMKGYEFNWCYLFILPFFIYSLFIKSPIQPILISCILFLVVTAVVFFGDPRFRYPLEPVFILGAGYVIGRITKESV